MRASRGQACLELYNILGKCGPGACYGTNSILTTAAGSNRVSVAYETNANATAAKEVCATLLRAVKGALVAPSRSRRRFVN
jgi:hypothetical protein